MILRSLIKQIAFLIGVLIAVMPCIAHATATATDQLKVVVHGSANVNTNYFTLGDIAEITPMPQKSKASALLAATVVGRSPLAGESRFLNRGDIILKLREANIDPSTVDLEGATTVYVTTTGAVNSVSPSPDITDPVQAKACSIDVKAGDSVDLVLVDGPVSVHAKAIAVSSGAVGDKISVRRDGSMHTLAATIIAAGIVQLEE